MALGQLAKNYVHGFVAYVIVCAIAAYLAYPIVPLWATAAGALWWVFGGVLINLGIAWTSPKEEPVAETGPISRFWQELNRKNERQLRDQGIGNIKRTLAQYYFTWVIGWRHDQFRALVRKTKLADWPEILSDFPRFDAACGLSRWRFWHLVVFTRMLYLYVRRYDRLQLLGRLAEPAFGNPFPVYFRGKLISQDLINSVLEFYAMFDGREIDFDAPLRICEIGAGYGRDAFVLLSLFPNCAYTIIDIHPAIDVSRQYLAEVCPTADISFLSPDAAELLPADSFDLVINISSFHEMTPGQVERYFALVDRVLAGRFYIKQWKQWHNPTDDVTLTEASYPYRPAWRQAFSRTTLAQPSFFEAVYQI